MSLESGKKEKRGGSGCLFEFHMAPTFFFPGRPGSISQIQLVAGSSIGEVRTNAVNLGGLQRVLEKRGP